MLEVCSQPTRQLSKPFCKARLFAPVFVTAHFFSTPKPTHTLLNNSVPKNIFLFNPHVVFDDSYQFRFFHFVIYFLEKFPPESLIIFSNPDFGGKTGFWKSGTFCDISAGFSVYAFRRRARFRLLTLGGDSVDASNHRPSSSELTFNFSYRISDFEYFLSRKSCQGNFVVTVLWLYCLIDTFRIYWIEFFGEILIDRFLGNWFLKTGFLKLIFHNRLFHWNRQNLRTKNHGRRFDVDNFFFEIFGTQERWRFYRSIALLFYVESFDSFVGFG